VTVHNCCSAVTRPCGESTEYIADILGAPATGFKGLQERERINSTSVTTLAEIRGGEVQKQYDMEN